MEVKKKSSKPLGQWFKKKNILEEALEWGGEGRKGRQPASAGKKKKSAVVIVSGNSLSGKFVGN